MYWVQLYTGDNTPVSWLDANRYGYRAGRLKGERCSGGHTWTLSITSTSQNIQDSKHVPLKSRPEVRGSEVLEVLQLVESKVSQVFRKRKDSRSPWGQMQAFEIEDFFNIGKLPGVSFSFCFCCFFFLYLTSKVWTIRVWSLLHLGELKKESLPFWEVSCKQTGQQLPFPRPGSDTICDQQSWEYKPGQISQKALEPEAADAKRKKAKKKKVNKEKMEM